MKVFQVLQGICYYDATPIHPTLNDTVGKYAPNIVFMEAPDYVFEGWGYDSSKTGDERFIQPTPPEGWRYDPKTGSFQKIESTETKITKSPTERITDLEAENKTLKTKLDAETKNAQFLEDCIAEMATVVYA